LALTAAIGWPPPTTTFPFRGTFFASSHVTDDIVRVGVNYRLGSAVMSKY
jgi:outer membrane immunogenic protein